MVNKNSATQKNRPSPVEQEREGEIPRRCQYPACEMIATIRTRKGLNPMVIRYTCMSHADSTADSILRVREEDSLSTQANGKQ